MLQILRHSVGSMVIKVLFGLLVLSFAAWGIGDIFNPTSPSQEVASAGDTEISQQDFLQAMRNQEAQLRAQGLDVEQLRQFGLADQVLSGLVNRALYEAEANELGLAATDEIVGRIIRENPAFQNSAGEFDRARYEVTLANRGYRPQYYESVLRRDVIVSTLVGTVNGGVSVPNALAKDIYKWREETRDALIAHLPINQNADVGMPTEEEIKNFYEDRKELFRAPEYRKITYVGISPEALAETIELDESQIKDAYEQRKDEFTTPERRKVLQMLLPDQETAQQALDAIQDGGDFIEVGKDLAGMSEKDMDLGTVSRSELPDDSVADAAFSLIEGEVSEPKEGFFGWFIVTTPQVQPQSVRPFDEVADQIRQYLATNEAIDLAYTLSNDLDDKIAGGATIEEAAADLNLPVRVFEAIDRTGKDESGSAVKDLPKAPNFLKFAFETDEGLDSLMQDDGQDGFFILRVDGVTESRIKDLQEVRIEVVELWQQDARRKLARSNAEEVVAKVDAGASLKEVIAAYNVEVTSVEDITREGQNPSGVAVPAPLVSDLFALEKGKAATAFAGNSFAIAALTNVDTPELQGEAIDSLKANLANGMANDLIAQFNAALRDKHTVSVNRPLVDSLLQN